MNSGVGAATTRLGKTAGSTSRFGDRPSPLRLPAVLGAALRRNRAPTGGPPEKTGVIRFADLPRHCPAALLESREPPEIGKIAALLWLDRLHGTIVSLQQDAFEVRPFHQRQAAAILPDPGVSLDELVLRQPQISRHPPDFRGGDPDLAGPATTGRTPLAIVENRHGIAPTTSPRARRPSPTPSCLRPGAPPS